ncbi:MAG: pectinesterase family protein [Lachnospiraceae bacterium]|nr:pectinesterase family protein [Ruminococcus sp.]MCM1274936.1 pectinesterase family protein [Lachnospiraceae bacterium]
MKEITVSPNENIAEAVRAAGPHTRVLLSEGVYRQKTEISVPYIELVGAGTDKTVIVHDDYAKKIHADGKEYNTFRTYTLAVLAPHVNFKDLAVENDALKPEEKGQEVALTVYADDFYAENCAFISTQDTVFCGPLPSDLIVRYDGFLKNELRAEGNSRQIYKNCYIAGTVDFIFGCADALFENCEIKSLYDVRGHGYAAAPAHAPDRETGFVFDRCRFTRDERVANGSIYLARPWRDYGKASFIDCSYGAHIAPEGFDKWNDTERDKTARFSEYGVPRAGRVPWSRELTAAEKDALLEYFARR